MAPVRRGRHAAGETVCWRCGGKGHLEVGQQDCRSCAGSGRNPADTRQACLTCGGSGQSGVARTQTCEVCFGHGTLKGAAGSGGTGGASGGTSGGKKGGGGKGGSETKPREPVPVLKLGVSDVTAWLSWAWLAPRMDGEAWGPLALAAAVGAVAAAFHRLVLGAAALGLAVLVLTREDGADGEAAQAGETARAGEAARAVREEPAAEPVAQAPPSDWAPGRAHPEHPHVVAGAEAGRWEPAPGYAFVDPTTTWETRWMPGTIDPVFHMVASPEEGLWHDAHHFDVVAGAGGGYEIVRKPMDTALAPGAERRLFEPERFGFITRGAGQPVSIFHDQPVAAIDHLLFSPEERWVLVTMADGTRLDLGHRVPAGRVEAIAAASEATFLGLGERAGVGGAGVVVPIRLARTDCAPRSLPDGSTTRLCP